MTMVLLLLGSIARVLNRRLDKKLISLLKHKQHTYKIGDVDSSLVEFSPLSVDLDFISNTTESSDNQRCTTKTTLKV